MKHILSKLDTLPGAVVGANPLRTNDVEGILLETPKVGRPLLLLGQSLTPGLDARLVLTSPVTELCALGPNHYRAKTHNTLYELIPITDAQ